MDDGVNVKQVDDGVNVKQVDDGVILLLKSLPTARGRNASALDRK